MPRCIIINFWKLKTEEKHLKKTPSSLQEERKFRGSLSLAASFQHHLRRKQPSGANREGDFSDESRTECHQHASPKGEAEGDALHRKETRMWQRTKASVATPAQDEGVGGPVDSADTSPPKSLSRAFLACNKSSPEIPKFEPPEGDDPLITEHHSSPGPAPLSSSKSWLLDDKVTPSSFYLCLDPLALSGSCVYARIKFGYILLLICLMYI